LAAIRSMRRQPFVAFALVYVAVFTFAFSSVANFGILPRERVQVLPMFLVLLSSPPAKHEEPKREELGVVRP